MNDWSDALVDHLDGIEEGLASTLGLEKGLPGDAFEERLGAFLAWTRTFDSTERFAQVGRRSPAGVSSDVIEWIQHARRRTTTIVQGVTTSMWSEFGAERIDVRAGAATYRRLVDALGLRADNATFLSSATTNYDRSGEMCLGALGLHVDTGARGEPWRTTVLVADEVTAWTEWNRVPHLHLHGAVGWYRQHGSGISVYPADQGYDNRSAPAVLYPDPEKDPEGELEMGVGLIWRKFREVALSATHVLVVGHSLHDKPLVAVLGEAAVNGARIAVSYFDDPEPIAAQLRADARLREGTVDLSLPKVHMAPDADFGQIASWIEGQIIQPR